MDFGIIMDFDKKICSFQLEEVGARIAIYSEDFWKKLEQKW